MSSLEICATFFKGPKQIFKFHYTISLKTKLQKLVIFYTDIFTEKNDNFQSFSHGSTRNEWKNTPINFSNQDSSIDEEIWLKCFPGLCRKKIPILHQSS